MAAPSMTVDLAVTVHGTEIGRGQIDVPVKTTTGEPRDGHVAVKFEVDQAGLMANIASVLRAAADELESGGAGDG